MSDKKGFLYLLIAHTGQGKTTFAKRLSAPANTLVFDVNNEYKDYPRNTTGDFDNFLQQVMKTTDKNIIFEEATGFLAGRTGAEVKRIVINKRHTNNNYIFLFHSIADVPPFLFRLSNYVILFKTADTVQGVKEKEPKLLKPFLELQRAENFKYKILKMI